MAESVSTRGFTTPELLYQRLNREQVPFSFWDKFALIEAALKGPEVHVSGQFLLVPPEVARPWYDDLCARNDAPVAGCQLVYNPGSERMDAWNGLREPRFVGEQARFHMEITD